MSDLSEVQSSLTVKIVGTDATGLETTPVNADNDGLMVSQRHLNENEDHTQIYGKNQDTGLPIALNLDNKGNLIVTALSGFGADFRFGKVSTAATTKVPVRSTAYTERTSNTRPSISSSSANDSAAGTGARKVKIYYLDRNGTGPSVEEVTLNGTTAVNLATTNLCYVERMEVSEVGSGGANAGIITLFNSIGGAGGAIGTIAVGDNKTFWAHHYVPQGKTVNVTGISVSNSSTTVGAGAVYTLMAKQLSFTAALYPEKQVSDFVRLYGQSSTATRNYGSPIKVDGPARLLMYVTPESTTSTEQRASMDFFEP